MKNWKKLLIIALLLIPAAILITAHGKAETGLVILDASDELTLENDSGINSTLNNLNQSMDQDIQNNTALIENKTIPLINETNTTDSENTTGIVQDNYTLKITTHPTQVEISLDGSYSGKTDASGVISLTVESGEHDLVLEKSGYVTQTDTLLIDRNITVNYTLPVAGENGTDQNLTDASIISLTSSLESTNGTYHMFEIETATFTATLDKEAQVVWSINGKNTKITSGMVHVFEWTPGPLYTSNNLPSTVTAMAGGDSASIDVNVEYVVNPFFDGNTGADTAQINVFANKNYYVFANLSAEIASDDRIRVIPLVMNYEDSDEALFVGNLIADEGNNYITGLSGTLESGEEVTLDLGKERAHYRTVTTEDNDRDRSPAPTRKSLSGTPKLVYVLFSEDVISVNDTQEIRLDTENFEGGVHRVEADVLAPDGEAFTVRLMLVDGSEEYGTWSGEINRLVPGKYMLKLVRMWGWLEDPVEEEVEEISFFATAGQAQGEPLTLVNTLISKNRAQKGDEIELSVDARDTIGIEEVTAIISSNRGDDLTISLSLIEGDDMYGTWKGTFIADEADATYSLDRIILANRNESASFDITGRSVYVKAEKNPVSLTGAAAAMPETAKEYFQRMLRKPLVPTMLGFGTMFIIAGIGFLNDSFRGTRRS